MTISNSLKFASAGGIIAAALMFSLSAPASAATAGSRCEGPTRDKVIRCCEQMVANSSSRRILGAGSCQDAVVCKRVGQTGQTHGLAVAGGAGGKYCWLRKTVRWNPNYDSRDPQHTPDPRDRNNGNQQGGTQGSLN
jgi:hypothetical protein